MSPLVYSALTAVIFTSAAGALVMCLLVFKYGFQPSPDELPSASVRRLFITRLGHALAGTCFATAAILAAVTLADLARVAPPTAAALAADERRAAEARLGALTSRVSAAESGLQNADERVRKVEAGLRRVGDDVRKVAASDAQAARPRAAAPPPSRFAEPRVVSPPVPKPTGSAVPNNAPQPPGVGEPRVVSPPVPKPAAPAMPNNAPQPSSFAEPRVVSPVVPKPARPAPPKSPPPDDLGSRLRRDWDAVKRGFTTAGSEFSAAVDEQARALRGAGN